MKYLIIFAFLIGGISADALQPEVKNDNNMERIIDGIVIRAINNITRFLREEGFDPLEVPREAREIALAVPEIFSAFGIIEDVAITGLSDIQILNLQFSLLTLTLNYHFTIPRISIATGHTHVKISGFGESIDGDLSGRVDIIGGNARGLARVIIGVEQISLRDLVIDLRVDRIDSNISELRIYIYELTDRVNELIGETIPGWLVDFNEDINTFLEIVLWDPIERALNTEW